MRRTRAIAVGFVALATSMAAGCSSGSSTSVDSTVTIGASRDAGDGTTSVETVSPGTRVATAGAAATAADGRTPQDVVRGLALTTADVPEGLTVALFQDGDQVEGQVTLDACGTRFPSEALRVARYQVGVRTPDQQFAMSNENVVYTRAADAAQAIDELRAAVTSCPADEFVPSVLQGQPAMKYRYQPIPDDELGTVAPDHLALAAHAETRQGEAFDLVLVFQRRGRVLVGLYAQDLATLRPSIGLMARRLADLSPADAGDR